MINRHKKNENGRDFIIGDIHGQFSRVTKLLGEIGFDEVVDRLFSVGDLIDRGPESGQVLDWLNKPWFFPVRGNHEDFACQYPNGEAGLWIRNGGGWFWVLSATEKVEIVDRIKEMPIAIELETGKGLIGIVHADIPGKSWNTLTDYLATPEGLEYCVWSRTRIEEENDDGVRDIRAVVVGHTPLPEGMRTLGNVLYIDTAGWAGIEGGRYRFTILDAATLEPVTP